MTIPRFARLCSHPLATLALTLGLGLGCGPDGDPESDGDSKTSAGGDDSSTSADATTASSGDDDDDDEPVDCDNLPPLPAAYTIVDGPASSEDFVFDGEGRLLSVQQGNLYATNKGETANLLIPGAFSYDTAGTLMLEGGDLVVADVEAGQLIRMTQDGVKTTLVSGLSYPNGVSSDLSGFVYVSEHDAGRVRRVDPNTGEFTIIAEGLLNPNGLTFSPDYSRLYIGSFGGGTVHAVDLAPDGAASNLHVYAEGFGGEGSDEAQPSSYDELLQLVGGDESTAQLVVSACDDLALADECVIDFGDGEMYPGACAAFDEGGLFCWPSLGAGFDGIGVDVCGNVYITEYVAGLLWRVRVDGTVEVVADFSQYTEWIPNIRWGSGVGGWDPQNLYVMDRGGDRV